MKTVALYLRVSSVDQHPETQLYDLRAMAQQRGFQIVAEYTDRISGTKARRPGIDTGGPLGRAVVIIIGAIAELERNLIIERVRAGMRRARLEGRHIGRRPLEIDRVAVLRDRNRGDSLTNIAKAHRVSRATVSRLLKQAKDAEPLSV
jgi:DNA invertase Pin-like site-specific DNA recombinase